MFLAVLGRHQVVAGMLLVVLGRHQLAVGGNLLEGILVVGSLAVVGNLAVVGSLVVVGNLVVVGSLAVVGILVAAVGIHLEGSLVEDKVAHYMVGVAGGMAVLLAALVEL